MLQAYRSKCSKGFRGPRELGKPAKLGSLPFHWQAADLATPVFLEGGIGIRSVLLHLLAIPQQGREALLVGSRSSAPWSSATVYGTWARGFSSLRQKVLSWNRPV